MKAIAALFVFVQLALLGSPLMAHSVEGAHGSIRSVSTESWIEEWDPAQQRWVKVASGSASERAEPMPTVVTTIVNGDVVSETRSAARYAQPLVQSPSAMALAQYGPFVVTSSARAALVGSTNSQTPLHFDVMLRDYPGIATLDMIEAPGTSNDIANLATGRKIRAAGIATHVPRGGSVRSGAVELFLAGATRSIEDGAQFAVHSWLDNYGREADDFAPDHEAHRLYLDYYVEMGMSEAQARAFYEMTNSVPHASARWLAAGEMRQWITPERPERYAARQIAGADAERVRDMVRDMAKQALAVTARHLAALTWGQRGLDKPSPAIQYHDVSRTNVARLDASLLDSALAFP